MRQDGGPSDRDTQQVGESYAHFHKFINIWG